MPEQAEHRYSSALRSGRPHHTAGRRRTIPPLLPTRHYHKCILRSISAGTPTRDPTRFCRTVVDHLGLRHPHLPMHRCRPCPSFQIQQLATTCRYLRLESLLTDAAAFPSGSLPIPIPPPPLTTVDGLPGAASQSQPQGSVADLSPNPSPGAAPHRAAR